QLLTRDRPGLPPLDSRNSVVAPREALGRGPGMPSPLEDPGSTHSPLPLSVSTERGPGGEVDPPSPNAQIPRALGRGREITAQGINPTAPDEKTTARGPESTTTVLYISPLKALGNDIKRNLETPLAEIRDVAGEFGFDLPPITT